MTEQVRGEQFRKVEEQLEAGIAEGELSELIVSLDLMAATRLELFDIVGATMSRRGGPINGTRAIIKALIEEMASYPPRAVRDVDPADKVDLSAQLLRQLMSDLVEFASRYSPEPIIDLPPLDEIVINLGQVYQQNGEEGLCAVVEESINGLYTGALNHMLR